MASVKTKNEMEEKQKEMEGRKEYKRIAIVSALSSSTLQVPQTAVPTTIDGQDTFFFRLPDIFARLAMGREGEEEEKRPKTKKNLHFLSPRASHFHLFQLNVRFKKEKLNTHTHTHTHTQNGNN